jgi:ATP synthase F1, delta subunit
MLAKEYATALFELASSNNMLDEIINQFDTLMLAINENEDFMKVLTYPRISSKQKKECIKNVCKSMNEIFVNFLYVLIDNNRVDKIKEIYEEFTNLVNEKNNILIVNVISASKLSSSQLNDLEIKLAEYFGKKHISINPLIDEKLIGGIKVIANGKSIDLSLNSKLQSLKDNI